MKNIAYLICTLKGNSGTGGHYFSLKTTATWIGEFNNVIVVNIGQKISPVINDSNNINFKNYFLKINFLKYFISFFKLYKILKKHKTEYIHCFDRNAYLWGSIMGYFLKRKVILTKCGGPIPKWFPRVEHLIVYNKTDYNYFLKTGKTTELEWIPNRVLKIQSDEERINNLKLKYNIKGKIVILRIARFTKLNKQSLVQSINLIKYLNKQLTEEIILLIIGHKQNQLVFNEILEYAKNDSNIYFETNEIFTKNANELIPISDIVVASGRSLMEAAIFEKILLIPTHDTKHPVLLQPENFDNAFQENFSSRYCFYKSNIQKSINDELQKIVNIISSEQDRNKLQKFIKNISTDFFLIESVKNKYSNLYSCQETKNTIYFGDTFINLLITIKTIFK